MTDRGQGRGKARGPGPDRGGGLLARVLPRGRFGRAVSLMAGGSAAGQLILILSSPILTRLYTPADFGVYAVYTATLGILGVVVALSYEYAIPLAPEEDEALNVVALSVVSAAVMCLLAWGGLAAGGAGFLAWANATPLLPYLWTIPLGLLGLSLYRVMNFWAVRRREYGRIARTSVYKGLGHAGTQVGLGLAGIGPLGLVAGHIVGQTSGAGSLSRSLRAALREWPGAVRPRRVLEAARRYWKFPAFSATGGLLNSGGLYLPAVLFSALYSPEVAGLVALGQRTVGLPVTLVSRSVSQVFVGEATDGGNMDVERVRRLFRRLTARLLLLALPAALLMLLLAPTVFGFVFGSEWREAGVYVQMLVLMFVARFVLTAAGHTLKILERQDRQFLWDLFRLVVMAVAIVVPALQGGSARLAVLCYSIGMCLSYLVLYWIMATSLRTETPTG